MQVGTMNVILYFLRRPDIMNDWFTNSEKPMRILSGGGSEKMDVPEWMRWKENCLCDMTCRKSYSFRSEKITDGVSAMHINQNPSVGSFLKKERLPWRSLCLTECCPGKKSGLTACCRKRKSFGKTDIPAASARWFIPCPERGGNEGCLGIKRHSMSGEKKTIID